MAATEGAGSTCVSVSAPPDDAGAPFSNKQGHQRKNDNHLKEGFTHARDVVLEPYSEKCRGSDLIVRKRAVAS